MRRPIALMLITLISIAALHCATTPDASATESLQPIVMVQRDLKIINGGILFMNDTFTLSAPSDTQLIVSEFWTGLHSSFIYERFSFEIWQNGKWVPMEHSEQSYDVYRGQTIVFPSSMSLDNGDSLKLRSSYLFVNRVNKRANLYDARTPVYPALQYNMSSFKMSVELPLDARFDNISSSLNFTQTEVDGIWKVDHESENAIGPYANVNATISYVPSPEDEYLLDCEMLERKIIVHWGSLRVEDSYTLINAGDRVNVFHLKLPVEASNIVARDGIGVLSVTMGEAEEEGDRIDVYVTPRSGFRSWDRWRFVIAYTMPKDDFVTSADGGSTLAYPNSDFTYYIRDLSAVVVQPEVETFVFNYGASLLSERPEIEVELPPASIMPILRPLSSLFVIAGAAVAVVALRRRRKPPVEVKPVEVEIPKLSEFIERQTEHIKLLKEVEGLEQRLEEKTIGRDRFDQRMAEINRRVGELNGFLRQQDKTLREEEPTLRDRLREIRRAEGEIERLKDDMRNLEVRLRARRISRRDYERRRKDRIRRRSQAIKRLEQAVASLAAER